MLCKYYANLHFVFLDVANVCMNNSITAACQATVNTLDETKVDLLVNLSGNTLPLTCIKAYEILLNGENRTVPVGSPWAIFDIIVKELPLPSLEGKIYTIDFEDKTSHSPCHFSILGKISIQ